MKYFWKRKIRWGVLSCQILNYRRKRRNPKMRDAGTRGQLGVKE
jgi:hypothetical protein